MADATVRLAASVCRDCARTIAAGEWRHGRVCRDCRRAYNKRHHAARPPEKAVARRQRANARRRERYAADPEYRNRVLKRSETTRSLDNQRRRQRYAVDAPYRARTIDRVIASTTRRRDAVALYQASWRRANQSRRTFLERRRRVRKIGNGGTHTLAEWRDKCALLGNVCIYCGQAKKLTEDHKVPLSRGGSDDITNIVPACMDCNVRKGRRTAPEFLLLGRAA